MTIYLRTAKDLRYPDRASTLSRSMVCHHGDHGNYVGPRGMQVAHHFTSLEKRQAAQKNGTAGHLDLLCPCFTQQTSPRRPSQCINLNSILVNNMANGDENICNSVREALIQNGIFESEQEIQYATKFSVRSGTNKAGVIVYNSGKIHVEGPDSELKKWLGELKGSIESGAATPGILLPAEIEKFPQTLQDRVPDCDGVVLWFFQEALRCYKAGSTAGAAFMLGAASEKAILLLTDTYGNRIKDEKNREGYFTRINSKMISVKHDEFKRSYKSATPKPKELPLSQDLEQLLDGAFNFYRHTRNAVGHPQIIPDIDKGVILANLGQFIVYVERIYGLMAFYQANDVAV